ncbi:MAG: sulfotransferase family 2 domain-containing protein [Candidatus Cloacimonetes bacterium]|nr:sulfotransferase family 2 domain-containing protein [Candidatus Cloacimonadota bacterium]
MISHKHQCIFIHIPRCGGTSIEYIIWPNEEDRNVNNLWMGFISKYKNKYQTGGLQHLLATQIQVEVGNTVFKKYFKFAFVRNPWDKAVSQFLYMKQRMDLRSFIGMDKNDDFKKYLYLIQKKSHVQWKPQYTFLENKDGKVLVDFIGRFECFENDVLRILKKIRFDKIVKIPHIMKSKRIHYRFYYDSESEEIVRNIYKIDISKFGYSF